MKKAVIILAVILQDAANRIFKQHKALQKIWMTADGLGFTKKPKAEGHAKYLDDDKVELFERQVLNQVQDDSEALNQVQGDNGLSREELVKEYKAQFGKKPPHNMKTDNILKRVREGPESSSG